MKTCTSKYSIWVTLLLLHSACLGCAWVSYSEPDPGPGFSESLPTKAKGKPIRLHVTPGMSPALLDGFKKGVSALDPYYWRQGFHDTIVGTGKEKVIVCRLDVTTDSSVGRLIRGFLLWFTLYLIPQNEEREYTLALKLLADNSEIKAATYVVKERYYRWLFAVQAPSSLSGEWMREENSRDPKPSQRLGEILGKTTAAFCRDRQSLD